MGSQDTNVPKSVYVVAFTSSLAGGFYWPYISIYAVEIEASFFEIGLVSSISNAAPTVFQPIWGTLSDRMLRRVIFVVLGHILGGLIVLLFTRAHDPFTYTLLVALSMISLSAVTPAWSSYIGSFFKREERGRGIGRITGIGVLGNVLGAGVSGAIMTMLIGEHKIAQYTFTFSIAGILLILTGLIALSLKEQKQNVNQFLRDKKNLSLRNSLSQNYLFRRLCLVEAFWWFTLSFAWPMYSAAYIIKLHATKLEIAICSMIFNATFAVSQMSLGYLADKYGRRTILLTMRYIFPIYPLIWYIAQDVEFVYLANFIVGIANALASVAVMSYILDITKEEERASYFAIYNMVMGISQFIGSLSGGFLGDIISRNTDPMYAIQMIFLISIIIRIASAIPYYFIEETLAIGKLSS